MGTNTSFFAGILFGTGVMLLLSVIQGSSNDGRRTDNAVKQAPCAPVVPTTPVKPRREK